MKLSPILFNRILLYFFIAIKHAKIIKENHNIIMMMMIFLYDYTHLFQIYNPYKYIRGISRLFIVVDKWKSIKNTHTQ